MEDILLMDAIERYISGEMNHDELVHFEHLRKTNAEIDQMIVDHRYFGKMLEQYSDRKTLRSHTDSIHAELTAANELVLVAPTVKKGKIVNFYNRFRKQIAVAATVAGLVSLVTLGMMLAFKSQYEKDFDNLSEQLKKETEAKIAKASTAVDRRSVAYRSASSLGSGCMINASGYLITNQHVVGNSKSVVLYNEKFGELSAQVVKVDADNDLALLKIDSFDNKYKTIRLPYSLVKSTANIGHDIFSLGYSREESIVYNQGYISSAEGYKEHKGKNRFLLTLNAEGGNSGSPIFNNRGEIVGLISQKETVTNGYVVGIHSASIKKFITENIKEGKTIANTSTALGGLSQEAKNKKIQDFIFMIRR
jgi:S1-C subfamily serine protease